MKKSWFINAMVWGCMAGILTGCSYFHREEVLPEQKENQMTGTVHEIWGKEMEEACNTPFGKYPEKITYTLGKMTSAGNGKMPETDSYENNAYTRYLLEKLNIQNQDVFEGEGDIYDNLVAMAITEKNIPDIMVVEDYRYVKLMVEKGLIEDLTPYYEKCASQYLKEIYSSYGDIVLENVTFDGKLMALPETNIDDGPYFLWLRKDWIDALGLSEPKTLEDAEYIISQFIEKDPGKNGEGNTVGFACAQELLSDYVASIAPVFAEYHSYPKRWVKDQNGEIIYGSVAAEAKEGLRHLHEMYERGLLDHYFLLRTIDNVEELIEKGQCGSFFGKWWSPNSPLMEAYRKNPQADWQPYLLSNNEEGGVRFCSNSPCGKYVVVRKGYEHPELLIKMHSVLFNQLKYGDSDLKEIASYFQNNVEPTARPCVINLDFSDAYVRCYKNLSEALKGEKAPEELSLLEHSYYDSCKNYLKDPKQASLEEWAAYMSRIQVCSLLTERKVERVPAWFWGETDTMAKSWDNLLELEEETYLKIVTGEKPIEYFDEFVNMWKEQGGEKITQEVRECVNGRE